MNTKLLIYLMILFSACSSYQDQQLEYALKLAKGNRQELDKVLEYYQNEPEKLIAAHFLIRNMIGKQVIDSNSISKKQPFFDAFTNYVEQYGSYKNDIQYIIYDSIKQLSPNTESYPLYFQDLQILSSDFLIRHIDNCFHLWHQYPWSKDIDANTFQKYILPYTTNNCYWEQAFEFFSKKYTLLRDTVRDKPYEEIGVLISNDIDKKFLQEWNIFRGKYKGLLPTTFKNMASAQIGTCLEENIYKIAALRMNGIPAVLNTHPGWGNADSPHFWTEIVGDRLIGKLYDNTQRPYYTERDVLITNMFWMNAYNPLVKEDIMPFISIQYCRTVPKVYRLNYELMKNSLALSTEEEIPDFFKNPTIEDITDKYIVCKDIEVPLWNNHPKKHIYLCSYDTDKWVPVSWSRSEGKRAFFEKMGVNMLYLPAYYDNGTIFPAGEVFILSSNGELKILSSQDKKTEPSATFYTKTPYRIRTALQAANTVGIRFYICNRKDLSDSLLVHTVDETPFYVDSFNISDNKKYHYLICDFKNVNSIGYPFGIGEIKIYDNNGNLITGEWSGTKGVPNYTLDKVADEDRVSFYQPNQHEKKQQIIFEIKDPRKIRKVEFYPRSDDNRIVTGELYELFYWDKKWISLGQQYSKDNKLTFHNIPQNALFRIHNHTRGKEHRPFTYEEGKQVWW